MDLLKKRYIYVISGIVVLLLLGCSQAWSIFVVPIETLFGWSRSQTSLAYTVNFLCMSFGSIMCGILSKKMSYSHLIKLVGILIFLGFFGCSLVSTPWQLYITFGLLVGVAVGMGYNSIMSSVPLWLPEKSATATGTLLVGYALSTAIFGPLLNRLIESIGILYTFKILSIICGIGIFLSGFIIRKPKDEELEILPKATINSFYSKNEYTTKEMVRKPIFYIYFIMNILIAGGATTMINHSSPMMIEGLLMTSALSAIIVSMGSISNGIARFFFGMIFDKIGLKKSVLVVSGIYLVASLGLFTSFSINNSTLFIIFFCMFMLCYAGNAVSIPTITRILFGNKNFSLNYSIVNLTCIFTSVIPTFMGTVQTMTGSYQLPLFFLVCMSILAMFFTLMLIREYQK